MVVSFVRCIIISNRLARKGMMSKPEEVNFIFQKRRHYVITSPDVFGDTEIVFALLTAHKFL